MSKVKLGQHPKFFEHTVKFTMLDGTEGAITVQYKYRTRSEFATFWDRITTTSDKAVAAEATATSDKAVAAEATASKENKRSLAKLFATANKKDGEDVLDMIDGWSLDEDLNLDNVMQLGDELPQAIATMVGDYYQALTTGRLGN